MRLLLAALVALVFSLPSEAGLFKRSSKPDPAVHVPALIETLKKDTDERARAEAASALREYDAKVFPEILPTLIDALASDKSSSVRAEAAESIGRVRPITAQAGFALEQARDNDKSLPVRLAARAALLQYRILGYINGVQDDVVMESKEPPLADLTAGKSTPSSTVLRPTPSPVPVEGPVTPKPILSKPIVAAMPASPSAVAPKRPQTEEPPIAVAPKSGPELTSQPKIAPPIIMIPPVPKRDSDGPSLPAVPKELPKDLDKSPAKPADKGPVLPPPPK